MSMTHAVQHDDGSGGGTALGIVRRVLVARPEGRGHEMEYFGTGDPHFSLWVGQKLDKREREREIERKRESEQEDHSNMNKSISF